MTQTTCFCLACDPTHGEIGLECKKPQTTDLEEYTIIYLQPWCRDCKNACDDRQWCQDDAWGECEECGRKAVLFVRAK